MESQHPEAVRSRERRKNDPRFREAQRKSWLKYEYGITVEAHDAMWVKQKGLCAACGESATSKRIARGHLDHNHNTGKIREILCIKCNVALGALKESPAKIIGLLHYLQRHTES